MIQRLTPGPPDDLDDVERRAFMELAFEPDDASFEFVRTGFTVGEFVLEHEIGRGGAGVVFAARQESLGRRVAIKFTPTSIRPADTLRLAREAQLLAQVRHEAIVGVHAAGSIAGLRYVAMDLIEGTTLRQWLVGDASDLPKPGTPEALAFVMDVLTRIAGALAAAHANQVVHRDVKPENILLDRQGRAYLADFGLARREDLDETVTQGFRGTLRYASPEQVRAQRVGAASDVFSFGAMAFEMLALRPAFAPNKGAESTVSRAITLADPVWPKDCIPSRDLRAVVEKCLEKRQGRRYQNGAELLADIERLRRFEPVLAVAIGPLSRLARRAGRRPLALASTVTLAAAAIIIGFLMHSLDRGERTLEGARARARLSQAIDLIRDGDAGAAKTELEALLRSSVARADAAGRLGDLALATKDKTAALANYELAIGAGSKEMADQLGLWLAQDDAARRVHAAPLVEPREPRDFAMLAAMKRSDGHLDEAAAALGKALAAEPTMYFWRIARAEARERRGRYEDALADYRVAREIRPKDTAAIDRIARLLILLGRAADAEQMLIAARLVFPDSDRLLDALGICLAKEGRTEEALALADAGLARSPRYHGFDRVRTRALIQLSRTQEAKTRIDALIASQPSDPWLLDARATIAYAETDWNRAEACGRTMAETLDWPWCAEGLGHVAGALSMLGRKQEALDVYQKLARDYPADPRWPLERGQVLVGQKRLGEARADAELAVRLAPQDVRALYLMARVDRATGRLDAALLDYERALGLDPERGSNYFWLADVWFALGEPRTAQRYVESAVAKEPAWFDAWILGALCCFEQDDMRGALLYYDHALSSRDQTQVRADRAEVLQRLGRDRESLLEYRFAREADPSLVTAWSGEGLLRLDSKDPAIRDPRAALCLLEHALTLDGDDPSLREFVERAQRTVALERDR